MVHVIMKKQNRMACHAQYFKSENVWFYLIKFSKLIRIILTELYFQI